MSRDKHRLHDRAMKLLKTIKTFSPYANLRHPTKPDPYDTNSPGISKGPELDYLVKHGYVKLKREKHSARRGITSIIPTEIVQ